MSRYGTVLAIGHTAWKIAFSFTAPTLIFTWQQRRTRSVNDLRKSRSCNLADLFTKPLSTRRFTDLRDLAMNVKARRAA